jgi:hypothetical protein
LITNEDVTPLWLKRLADIRHREIITDSDQMLFGRSFPLVSARPTQTSSVSSIFRKRPIAQGRLTGGVRQMSQALLRREGVAVLARLIVVVLLAWGWLFLGAGLGMQRTDTGGRQIKFMGPEWTFGYAPLIFLAIPIVVNAGRMTTIRGS